MTWMSLEGPFLPPLVTQLFGLDEKIINFCATHNALRLKDESEADMRPVWHLSRMTKPTITSACSLCVTVF